MTDVPALFDWRERIATGTLLAATGALVGGPVSWWPTTDRVTTAEKARHFVREVHRSGFRLSAASHFVRVRSPPG
jgi:hypothetical protein